MLKYKVVQAEGYDNLAMGVNRAIKEGWKPQGGVSSPASTVRAGRHRKVAQGMVKEVDESEIEPESSDDGAEEADEPAEDDSEAVDSAEEADSEDDSDSDYVVED